MFKRMRLKCLQSAACMILLISKPAWAAVELPTERTSRAEPESAPLSTITFFNQLHIVCVETGLCGLHEDSQKSVTPSGLTMWSIGQSCGSSGKRFDLNRCSRDMVQLRVAYAQSLAPQTSHVKFPLARNFLHITETCLSFKADQRH